MNYDKYLMTLCALVAGVGCAKRSSNHAARETSAPPIAMTADKPNDATKDYRKPPEQELQSKLTPLQYKVTQRDGTEPPFNNAYWDNKEAGLYVDVATGEPLFASVHKFDSGTGWPSFTRPVDREHVVAKTDASLGMVRTEVRSSAGDSHLGHLFDDGPGPEGNRYCINSASLRFIPVGELEKEGYGAYLELFADAK